jgi:mucin-2
MTGSTTGGSTGTTAVPVVNASGSQVGVAVTNPVTGSVELIGQGGTILGVIQQQNGMVSLVGSGGTVIGSFALNQATGQVTISAPATASGTTTGTTTPGTTTTGTTTTGTTTTGTATSGTTASGQQAAATAVPVYDSTGTQVGVVVTNPATGTPELIGAGGTVLGVIQQQNGMVSLVGSGGTVIGSFALNQATGHVTISAPAAASGTTTTATTGTTTTGTATSGQQAAATAVPVYDSTGTQVGVVVTNPATGTPELIGAGGAVLGVIQQQNGVVSLVGSGGSVLGSFALNQATGQVVFTAGGGTTTGMTTTTGATTSTTTTSATTGTTMPGATATAVPVFDTSGIQVGLATTNPTTGAVELVGVNGTILGVLAQQNGAVALIGAGGTVLGSFGTSQATGQVLFAPVPRTATGTGSSNGASTQGSGTPASSASTPATSTAPASSVTL